MASGYMSAGDEVKVFDAHISDGKGFWGCFAQPAFIKWLKFISPCCVVLDNCLLILFGKHGGQGLFSSHAWWTK